MPHSLKIAQAYKSVSARKRKRDCVPWSCLSLALPRVPEKLWRQQFPKVTFEGGGKKKAKNRRVRKKNKLRWAPAIKGESYASPTPAFSGNYILRDVTKTSTHIPTKKSNLAYVRQSKKELPAISFDSDPE